MILGWMMCTTKVKGWCTTDFTDPNKMGKLEGLVATWNERPDGKWDIKVRFRAKAHHICRSGKSSLQSGDNALRDPHILVALTKERLGMGLHSSASDTKTFYIHTPSSAENPPENNKCPFYEKQTGKTDWEGLKYLFVAVAAAILFHQMHALWKPHYNPLAYRLQHVALCAIEVVYLVGLLLLLKEPVPEGVLFGASGGTVAMGIIMLGMATYITFTKFIKLRKEDAAFEKDYEFQERLKSELRDHNLANNFRQEEEAERSSTKVNPVLEKDSSESSKVVKVSLPEVEKEKKTTAHDKFAKFLAEEGDTEEKAQKESDSKPNEMYMI